jgi:hypothetical protein
MPPRDPGGAPQHAPLRAPKEGQTPDPRQRRSCSTHRGLPVARAQTGVSLHAARMAWVASPQLGPERKTTENVNTVPLAVILHPIHLHTHAPRRRSTTTPPSAPTSSSAVPSIRRPPAMPSTDSSDRGVTATHLQPAALQARSLPFPPENAALPGPQSRFTACRARRLYGQTRGSTYSRCPRTLGE